MHTWGRCRPSQRHLHRWPHSQTWTRNSKNLKTEAPTCWKRTQSKSLVQENTCGQTSRWERDQGKHTRLFPETQRATQAGCNAPQQHNRCWRKQEWWQTSKTTAAWQHLWSQTYRVRDSWLEHLHCNIVPDAFFCLPECSQASSTSVVPLFSPVRSSQAN